ncbi:MAG: alpha/beta hydrolase [Acidimicrobiales bacterium]|nr:alpha/beta hydrolase [Acidimicrobiales bacterium]
MVMADRPEVETASAPIAALDLLGLGQQILGALARVPFRRPWAGPSTLPANMGAAVTREVLRTFMGYASSLRIEEFRSVELVLDELCRVVMPPVVALKDVATFSGTVGGVPGIWYRPKQGEAVGTILYLHGGGYIGTSPNMYAFFSAALARETECEIFVADYRLAPEFPFPAPLDDAVAVLTALEREGRDPASLFVAGDSGGGGLASSLVLTTEYNHLPTPAGVILFSPEVDLRLDEPSVTENARYDILPWNIPTSSYLHGQDASSQFVSPVDAEDLSRYPPTLVAFGDEEMFRDPIRRFVERLDAAGVPTVDLEEPGMFHVFPILMPWSDAARRVHRAVRTFVHERVREAGRAPGDDVG